VDIVEGMRIDPVVFGIVDFKPTVGRDTEIGQVDAIECVRYY
jgi:hypothetical protein